MLANEHFITWLSCTKEPSTLCFTAFFSIILGAEPDNPSHGYYLILWSEDRNVSVDTVICIDGKNAMKINENNSDEEYSEEQGYMFFKIYESTDPTNGLIPMDWSELNGNKCDIEIEIEISASNKKIIVSKEKLIYLPTAFSRKAFIPDKSSKLTFHDSKVGFMIGCKGKKSKTKLKLL